MRYGASNGAAVTALTSEESSGEVGEGGETTDKTGAEIRNKGKSYEVVQ